MALSPGTRLGPYEILSALGAGGMGEVYRATDTTLGRDVAIKTLPDEFARDPERVARFKREAQVLAALNHPHIAAIYGLEEVNGGQFLVLELVEGDTLAQRIAKGPVPVSEALRLARQVADALQAAHEKGIIHRDLKPANIALTHEGQVKVLDFGLARVIEPDPLADTSDSPTFSRAATQAGVIMGTAAYMSPEQAKGRVADKRSDVWAFGAVLYEMLTGKRAFEGDDVSDILATVLKSEPDWTALPADVPASIRTLVMRCLEKDRTRRVADIAAALFVIDEQNGLGPSGTIAALPLQNAAAVEAGGHRYGSRCRRGGRRQRRVVECQTVHAPADRHTIHARACCGPTIHQSRPPGSRDLAGRHASRVRCQPAFVPPPDVGNRGAADCWNRERNGSGAPRLLARRPIRRLLFGSRSDAQENCRQRRSRGHDLPG